MTTEPPSPPGSDEPTEPPVPPPPPDQPAFPPEAPPPPPPPVPGFPAEQPIGSPANLADWGTRALGYLIDIAPGLIAGLIFGYGIRNFFLSNLVGVLGIAYTAYMGYLDGLTGQTPGKAIMGTRVVNAQGEVIGAGAGIGRKFAHIIDSLVCLLGWFLPLVDARRQTIADKLLSTYVVEGVPKRPFAFDLWLPPKTTP